MFIDKVQIGTIVLDYLLIPLVCERSLNAACMCTFIIYLRSKLFFQHLDVKYDKPNPPPPPQFEK